MRLIAKIPNLRGGYLAVMLDTDTVFIGGRQLDLEGIGLLQVALDDAVKAIRAGSDD